MKVNSKYKNIINLNNFYSFEIKKYFSKIKKITEFILNEEKKSNYIIEVNFVDDNTIKKINKDYRKINKVTDVISLNFLEEGALIIDDRKYFF